MPSSPVIAIDGVAASGKGTLAHRLATHLGFAFLDTGLLYRAVGLEVLRSGGCPENEKDVLSAVRKLNEVSLCDPEIRSVTAGAWASRVAAIPEVRAHLLPFQRDFAQTPPGGKVGAVLDGRDIGTVICPNADIKFFMTADAEVRAKRRFSEQEGGTDVRAIMDGLVQRDERDANRNTAPMHAAEDAYLIDTTDLSAEAVFEQALKLVRLRIK